MLHAPQLMAPYLCEMHHGASPLSPRRSSTSTVHLFSSDPPRCSLLAAFLLQKSVFDLRWEAQGGLRALGGPCMFKSGCRCTMISL